MADDPSLDDDLDPSRAAPERTRTEKLLCQVLLFDWDDGNAVVLADWCEEKEFLPVAAALRKGPTEEAWRALNGLAIVLGVQSAMVFAPPIGPMWVGRALEGSGHARTQIDTLSFDERDIGAYETQMLEAYVMCPTRILRVMFDPGCVDALAVEDLRLGRWNVGMGGAAPARLLDGNDPSLPDLSTEIMQAGQSARITLRNTTGQTVRAIVGMRCRIMMPG